jgi:hypothetical protein
MTTQSFSVSALIPAPPARVCGIIADYHHGHPRILPKPAFESLVVEPGGLGAGTVVRVQMRLLAQRQAFRATVTEPASGRVLVETNHTGYITTFTVVPRANGEHAQVTFSSETPARPGVLAIFERWLVRQLLRPVYRKELALLAKVAADAAPSDPSTFKPGKLTRSISYPLMMVAAFSAFALESCYAAADPTTMSTSPASPARRRDVARLVNL